MKGLPLAASNAVAAPAWLLQAHGIRHEAIATVYATSLRRLPRPMVALRSGPDEPAQFVFDRGQLGGPAGLLAFVASAYRESKVTLEAQVMQQALDLLKTLGYSAKDIGSLQVLQTVVEKRATFACTPNLQRPVSNPHPNLRVCGDYIDGPYPATLEGAVMSGIQAIV